MKLSQKRLQDFVWMYENLRPEVAFAAISTHIDRSQEESIRQQLLEYVAANNIKPKKKRRNLLK